MNEAHLLPWLKAFVSTILVETPLYMLFLQSRMHLAWAALVSLGLQMVTHPTLWLLWPDPPYPYWETVGIAETCVWLAEAGLLVLVLGPRYWKRALLASLTANVISTVVGLLR